MGQVDHPLLNPKKVLSGRLRLVAPLVPGCGKKILKYLDTAAQFAKVEVHSGASTSFWYDN